MRSGVGVATNQRQRTARHSGVLRKVRFNNFAVYGSERLVIPKCPCVRVKYGSIVSCSEIRGSGHRQKGLPRGWSTCWCRPCRSQSYLYELFPHSDGFSRARASQEGECSLLRLSEEAKRQVKCLMAPKRDAQSSSESFHSSAPTDRAVLFGAHSESDSDTARCLRCQPRRSEARVQSGHRRNSKSKRRY